jgi:hypothetical protein
MASIPKTSLYHLAEASGSFTLSTTWLTRAILAMSILLIGYLLLQAYSGLCVDCNTVYWPQRHREHGDKIFIWSEVVRPPPYRHSATDSAYDVIGFQDS